MKDNLEIVGTVKLGGTGHNHYWTYYISPEGRLFKVKSNDGMMSEVNIALTSTNKYKGRSYGGYYAAPTNSLPNKYIHRMVATAFVHNDDPDTKTCVDHLDGNKHNNHYSNLEWVTRSENHKRMHARRRAEGKVWTGRRATL